MTAVTIPNRPSWTSGARAIASLLADFDAILAALNVTGLDPDNLSETLLNTKLGLSCARTAKTRRGTATVATSETTASTTPTDLATPGPSVTIDVAAGSMISVFATCTIANAGGAGRCNLEDTGTDLGMWASYAGAAKQLYTGGSTGTYLQPTAQKITYPTLAAGSRTIKMKYWASASTATFSNRSLWVMTYDPT